MEQAPDRTTDRAENDREDERDEHREHPAWRCAASSTVW